MTTKKSRKAPLTPEKMLRVVERAQAGDERALPALRKFLDQVPEMIEPLGADLESRVDTAISRMVTREDNLAFHAALRQKMASLRSELGGPAPTPLERLLVTRIVTSWLQVQEADLRASLPGNDNIARADYFSRRQDRAHSRFLSAIKALAQVRKLALPALQVNIAKRQTNIVAAASEV